MPADNRIPKSGSGRKIASAHPPPSTASATPSTSTLEQHFRIEEIASLWHVGRESIRRLVMDDPTVLAIRQGPKAINATYSIPTSSLERLHTRLLNNSKKQTPKKTA
jgi:hypothetical protein